MVGSGWVAAPNVLLRAVLGVGARVTLSKTSTPLERYAEAMIRTRVRIRIRDKVYEYQRF